MRAKNRKDTGTIRSIYEKMPVSLQNCMVSFYGLKLIFQRYGLAYWQHKTKLRRKIYRSYTECLHQQEKSLQDFIQYAVANSSFYRQFYQDIDINQIRIIEDLRTLPVLTKEILRENVESIRTIPPKKAIKAQTGGTTGKALKVYFDKADFQTRMAVLDYFRESFGLSHRMKRATFSGNFIVPLQQKESTPPFWRKNIFLRQRFYSVFHLTQDNIPAYISDLNSYKPQEINGFPSAIHKIAKYAKDHHISLDFRPKAVFVTSENLQPAWKADIEAAFGCPVVDQYASAEGAPFVMQCLKGNLHYHVDTGVIELIEPPGPSEILVTSFTTHGTPLIRYKIEDMMEFSSEACPCGSCLPVVKRVLGRKTDYLYTQEKGRIHDVNLIDVIKHLPAGSIIETQFVQHSPTEIAINLVIDKEKYQTDYDRTILDEMRYRCGNKVTYTIHKLEEIPRETSGKFRFVINNLPPEEKPDSI
jgi:phenylacetate-CoA ligase